MYARRTLCSWAIIAMMSLALSTFTQAQGLPPEERGGPTRDELVQLISDALPDQLSQDSVTLVKTLLSARLGTPLSRSFDLKRAIPVLFGRNAPTFAADCQQMTLPTGDPDPGECTASLGDASGRGTYTQLSFSKHLGLGTIKYSQRTADAELPPEELRPVQMSDAEAYQKAIDFLVTTFGLPKEEIPEPPPEAKNPFPVRDLVMAWGNMGRTKDAVPIQKVVSLRRGLLVGLEGLPWILAPGEAMVLMDDEVTRQVMIRNWQELRPHPDLDSGDAKTRDELINEIADDLMNTNNTPIASLRTQLLIASVPAGTHAFMIPAVHVYVSSVPRDPSEEEQNTFWSTAGFVREYALVRLSEGQDD